MMRIKAGFVLLIGFIVLGGCATTKQHQTTPAETPKKKEAQKNLPKPFDWPGNPTGFVKEPAYFAQEGVELFLISENFPLLLDILKVPDAFVKQLKAMDDKALEQQLEMWNQEQPPNIKFRMYENAKHVNVWFRRLLIWEILSKRPTDAGRLAREKLAKFFFANAGERVPGITFEPRRSILSALVADRKIAAEIEQFYNTVSQLPMAFGKAYERLAISFFKTARNTESREDELLRLADVLVRTRNHEHLKDVALALLNFNASKEAKVFYTYALCLAGDSQCVSAWHKLGDEGIDVPPKLGALARARDYLNTAEADPSDVKFYCEMFTKAGWELFENGYLVLLDSLLDSAEPRCANSPEFYALAVHAALQLYGTSQRLVRFLNAATAIKPWTQRFLTAAIYSHYLMSLPVLFKLSRGPQPLTPDWYFKNGPGAKLDEELREFAKYDSATADFIRLMLKVLAFQAPDGSPERTAFVNDLADEARRLADAHSDTPLFARLMIVLYSQRPTEQLSHLLETGEMVPRSDGVALMALLPHMLKLAHKGHKIPAWYLEAVHTLPADNDKRIEIERALTLFEALKDKKKVRTLVAEFVNNVGPDEELDERDIPRLALLLFNARSLLFIHRMPDPPRFGKDKIEWPQAEYWTNYAAFPAQALFEGLHLVRKNRLKDAAAVLASGMASVNSKSEKMGFSWWLAYLHKRLKDKQKFPVYATGAANIYRTFADQILLDERHGWALTLFDAAFNFNLRTGPQIQDRIELEFDYVVAPRLLPVPKLPMEQMEAVVKKLIENRVKLEPKQSGANPKTNRVKKPQEPSRNQQQPK